MLAEELVVLDADSHLWCSTRWLLDVALRLAQNDESYVWHGWNKQQITTFLQQLPAHCTLLAGVWDTLRGETGEEREVLVLGYVCEVVGGEVRTIRTFEALQDAKDTDLPPMEQLEPGYEHALALMRAARLQVASVAWALFTDKATWDEWLFGATNDGGVVDKGEQLAKLAVQGRCVLMGSQTASYSDRQRSSAAISQSGDQ